MRQRPPPTMPRVGRITSRHWELLHFPHCRPLLTRRFLPPPARFHLHFCHRRVSSEVNKSNENRMKVLFSFRDCAGSTNLNYHNKQKVNVSYSMLIAEDAVLQMLTLISHYPYHLSLTSPHSEHCYLLN